jgi:ATP-dependent DNA ligase
LPAIPAERPPTGPGWIHEIKHDGFRMMVRRDAAGVRLLTRNGLDRSARFPLIFEAAGALQVRSFLLDGEAVACNGDGMPVFDRLRYRRHDGRVFLYAFDLLELNGQDLRREPIEIRKRQLATLLRAARVAYSSTSIFPSPATSCSGTPARWVSRASSRSGSARATAPARSKDWLKMRRMVFKPGRGGTMPRAKPSRPFVVP